ncbi:AbrB family transcriptional regulator [Pseudochrobactrum sp. HB0163]|uniref:AbrB family transcriptional regulator n=1 Tax=Pseudochrobactrum sp. HB0163 TaxID=3450708 RepID=UPI003F6DC32A
MPDVTFSMLKTSPISFIVTFAIAGSGAATAYFAGFPIPFLLGSMAAITIASLCGLHIFLPSWLRNAVFIMLGVQAGSGVRPETLNQIGEWPLSFALLFVMLVAVTGFTFILLRYVFRWEAQTAFFSSLPGALSFVMAAASETRADLVKITIIQTVRLLLLIGLLAPVLNVLGQSAPHIDVAVSHTQQQADWLLLLVAGSAGALAGHYSRLPGGMMLGALLASALIYGTGFVTVQIPPEMADLGMVVLGVLIGSRVGAQHRGAIIRYLPVALSAFVIGTGTAAIVSALAWLATGLHPAQIALAFAPGALEALTVIAFSLGVDPAYVASHHVVRFMMIALFVPFVARALKKTDAQKQSAARAEA